VAVTEAAEPYVTGSEEAAKTLGALLARVENGQPVVITNRSTGQIRATILPGLPRDWVRAPGLEPSLLNGTGPDGPA
jgi:hypothetical protein